MSARVICLGCRALERNRDGDPWTRFAWAVRCTCGGVEPREIRELRGEMNRAVLAAEIVEHPKG